ncbi:hypothetical protein DPSP01_001722 [Paraphaeosphaeria sporulosa]|uniref:Uncharacterized protein n=1 Tax=Paraphaeosphaeria sporulosa TaxID=1460663 RepID=A0A177CT75_9PLEO|nr:uncharacterized protein CC84DRAFT_468606 [Paraphaeosphaeria sporulosa]OAG10188.1 hypothetical protein CC84DRAFT_468606 [Paraphaeosphaeria sporulosa]
MWNGVATGAAPFQQPQYANSYSNQQPYANQQAPQYGQQPGYNQYQGGFPPQPGVSPQLPKSFPPKKKGNPIITRYPPPPGYRGPAQPQGPFGTVQFSAQQQGFPQGPHPAQAPYPNQSYQSAAPAQGYPPPGYGPPQSHPSQQGYHHAQTFQWPSQNYPHQTPVSQSPSYPAPQQYSQQQTGYKSYPNPPPPINTKQSAWPSAQGWQQAPGSATYPPANQYNPYGASSANSQPTIDPNATPTPSSAMPTTAQPTPANTQLPSATSDTASDNKAPLFLGWDDWDFDFDGAIWPKANEPVDPDLSLGVITWRPAKQVTRALPATFEDAEEQSLRPPAEKLGNGESVSLYFTAENSYEAFLDVRKTDDWYNIKDDPAFVIFTDEEMKKNLISIEDCVSLRDRPDEKGDEDMNDPSWNVMDNLEQALSGDMEDVKKPTPPDSCGKPSRDQVQEDILAKLGVTGSPKPPSDQEVPLPFPRDDQLPASLPPKPPAPPSANIPPRPDVGPHKTQSYSGHRNSMYGTTGPRPYGSISSATSQRSSPAQPYERTNSCASIPPTHQIGSNHPEASNMAGSGTEEANHQVEKDFIPQLKRNDSSFARKRSYEDTDQEDGQTRQQDDHTKRKRRSQVDAAYR